MARPTKNDIDSGVQAWDGKMDDNDEVLFNGPIPIHEHVGDESDLQATFPANQFDRCSIMVDHSTIGWSLYVSDGTAWNRIWSVDSIPTIAELTNASGSGNDAIVAVSGSGDDGTINDNFRDCTDKLEEMRQAMLDHGLIT